MCIININTPKAKPIPRTIPLIFVLFIQLIEKTDHLVAGAIVINIEYVKITKKTIKNRNFVQQYYRNFVQQYYFKDVKDVEIENVSKLNKYIKLENRNKILVSGVSWMKSSSYIYLALFITSPPITS